MRAFTSNSDHIGVSPINDFEVANGALGAVVAALRLDGWKVRRYKKSDSGYISRDDYYAYKDRLKIKIKNDCRRKFDFNWNYDFELDFFEDLTPRDGRSGVYEFKRFDNMPYLMKLLSIKTVRMVKAVLVERGFIFPEDSSFVGFRKPEKWNKIVDRRNYMAGSHIKPELGRAEYDERKRISQDGFILSHRQVAFTRVKGRLIKGVIYYDIGNWIFVYGETSVICNVQCHEIIVKPDIKKGRVFSECYIDGRLQKELSNAVKACNYLMAHQLHQIVVKGEMYRIWSVKHGGDWWGINCSGYTKNVNNAGLYTKEHAERLCAGDDQLSMVKAH